MSLRRLEILVCSIDHHRHYVLLSQAIHHTTCLDIACALHGTCVYVWKEQYLDISQTPERSTSLPQDLDNQGTPKAAERRMGGTQGAPTVTPQGTSSVYAEMACLPADPLPHSKPPTIGPPWVELTNRHAI